MKKYRNYNSRSILNPEFEQLVRRPQRFYFELVRSLEPFFSFVFFSTQSKDIWLSFRF